MAGTADRPPALNRPGMTRPATEGCPAGTVRPSAGAKHIAVELPVVDELAVRSAPRKTRHPQQHCGTRCSSSVSRPNSTTAPRSSTPSRISPSLRSEARPRRACLVLRRGGESLRRRCAPPRHHPGAPQTSLRRALFSQRRSACSRSISMRLNSSADSVVHAAHPLVGRATVAVRRAGALAHAGATNTSPAFTTGTRSTAGKAGSSWRTSAAMSRSVRSLTCWPAMRPSGPHQTTRARRGG